MAVPALQRALVEPPAGLLQGRLQDDVSHGPRALQEGRTQASCYPKLGRLKLHIGEDYVGASTTVS